MANIIEFLGEVLPESPHFLFTRKVNFEKDGRQIKGMTVVVATPLNLSNVVAELQSYNESSQLDVYFATAGYDLPMDKADDILVHGEGNRAERRRLRQQYVNSLRNVAYITQRKCIYIDIDKYKGDELPADGMVNGRAVFHDMKQAMVAVKDVIERLNLPMPTYVVHSGRGVHVYWALTEAVEQSEWRYMQMQLNVMFRDLGNIEIDMSVAENGNGVMRIPTTLNSKSRTHGKLIKVSDTVHPVYMAEFLNSMLDREGITFAATRSGIFSEPPPEFLRKHMQLYNPVEWGGYDNPVPIWKKLTDPRKGCNFLRWCEGAGRMELGNEDWSAMATVAVNCENGIEVLHEVSIGHDKYQPDDVERRATSFDSIYSCNRIAGLDSGKVVTPACEGCRYIGKDAHGKPVAKLRNPTDIMNLIPVKQVEEVQTDRPLLIVNNDPVQDVGTVVETIKEDDKPLSLDVEVLSERVINTYMPDLFTILEPDRTTRFSDDGLGDGIAYKEVDPDEPSLYKLTRVTVGFVYVLDAIRDVMTNTLEYDFAVQQSDNKIAHVRLTSESLSSDDEITKLFASVGVIYHFQEMRKRKSILPLFLNYIRQSASKRMSIGQRFTSNINQFGWTSDKKAFLLGEWLIYGGERRERAHPSSHCKIYTDAMTPPIQARVRQWADACRIYRHEGMESAQFILGVSLATPVLGLLSTADAQGALINVFSTESGLGKTTLCHSALSIWGRPAPAGHSSGLSGINSDTPKARIFSMTLFQNIPYYMDETTDMKPHQMYQLVYQLTQGQDARRMKQSGVAIHDTIGGWNMVAMTSSNKSLVEKLYTQAGQSSDAVHARVLEIDMRRLRSARDVCDAHGTPMYTHEDIQRSFRLMQSENYAIVGQDYLVKVAHKRDQLVAEFAEIRRELDTVFNFQPHERFWANTAVLGIMGVRHGNRFGYFDFDETVIKAWLLNAIENIRAVRTESKVDIREILNEYIANWVQDSIYQVDERSVKWMGDRPSSISYRYDAKHDVYYLPVRRFAKFAEDGYKWTAKEVERQLINLTTTAPIRYRFLKGIREVGGENGSGQLTAWAIPKRFLEIGG